MNRAYKHNIFKVVIFLLHNDISLLTLFQNQELIIVTNDLKPINQTEFFKMIGIIGGNTNNLDGSTFQWRKDHGIVDGNIFQLSNILMKNSYPYSIMKKTRYDYLKCTG